MLDRKILSESRADSAMLRALETYGHRFDRAGRYRVVVRVGQAQAGRHWLDVIEDPRALPQATIDVAPLIRPGGDELGGHRVRGEDRWEVGVGGVALWHTGETDRELSVEGDAIEEGRGSRSFDSRQLRDGDLFSLALLPPGTYEVSNRLGRARGRIMVTNPRRFGGQDRDPSVASRAATVTCTERGFDPAEVEIERGQGMVWFVQGDEPFHIVVAPVG